MRISGGRWSWRFKHIDTVRNQGTEKEEQDLMDLKRRKEQEMQILLEGLKRKVERLIELIRIVMDCQGL